MTNKSRATGYRPNVGSTYKSSLAPDKEWENRWGILLLYIMMTSKPSPKRFPLGQLEKKGIEFIRQLLKAKDQEADRRMAEAKEQGIIQVGKWYKFPIYKELVMTKNIDGTGGDVNCGCSVCGGKPVTIRGRYPDAPKRKICPTCVADTLENILDNCNNRQPSTGKLSQDKGKLSSK